MTTGATALLRAAHGGPALAVTVLALLLAVAADLAPGRVALATGAVLAGQLTVGWSNDLRDRARDIAVGRTDKPLATGELVRLGDRYAVLIDRAAEAPAASLPVSPSLTVSAENG